jgi:hypothetical protein
MAGALGQDDDIVGRGGHNAADDGVVLQIDPKGLDDLIGVSMSGIGLEPGAEGRPLLQRGVALQSREPVDGDL